MSSIAHDQHSTYFLTLESAPVFDVSDGKRVGGLWVRHCELFLQGLKLIFACRFVVKLQ